MAPQPPHLPRGPSPPGLHIGGPMVNQPGFNKKFTIEQQPVPEEPLPGPPKDVYPCGCAYPGTHKPDCMWSLWEQMRDNYVQTRTLMGKFMSQVNTMQDSANEGVKCECPAGCHGTDLGTAMGLQQMTGVTVPWNMALGGPAGLGGIDAAPLQSYSVENEARRMMEEQRKIKNTWVQFLSIFDMALDLANDVSKDRWQQNRRRKERQRLEREQRLEEMRKERLERQKGSKPEPPPEKEKPSDKKDEKKEGKEEKPTQEKPEEKRPQTPAGEDKPEETKPEETANEEPAAEAKPTPEAEQPAEEEEGEEGAE